MIKIRLRYWGLKRRLPFKNQPIFLLSGVFIFVFKYFTLFKYIWIISVFTNSICIRFKLQNKYYLVFVFVPKSLFLPTLTPSPKIFSSLTSPSARLSTTPHSPPGFPKQPQYNYPNIRNPKCQDTTGDNKQINEYHSYTKCS